MNIEEYVLGLLAILSGLAITDMVSSTHGILRRVRQVKFGILPVCAALIVFEVICYSWWISWNSDWDLPFWAFLLVVLQLVGIFLAAKAVLPDDDGSSEPLDLVAHYWSSNRRVWLSLAFMNILVFAVIILLGETMSSEFIVTRALYITMELILVFFQKRWVHLAIVPTSLAYITIMWAGLQFSGSV